MLLRQTKETLSLTRITTEDTGAGATGRPFAVVSQKLKERFRDYPRIEKFIDSVKVQKRINPSYHLTRICEVFGEYADSDCTRCMEECFIYNTFSFPFVKGFLMSRAEVKLEVKGLSFFVKGYENIAVTRDLKEYTI